MAADGPLSSVLIPVANSTKSILPLLIAPMLHKKNLLTHPNQMLRIFGKRQELMFHQIYQ